jgi:hypothetical protein
MVNMHYSLSPVKRFVRQHILSHLREDVNSEKEAQPVSLVGIGSSVLQTSDPTESNGVPWVVSIGTSKLADQLGAKMRGKISSGKYFSSLVQHKIFFLMLDVGALP